MTQITVLTIPGNDYYEHMFDDHEITTYEEMYWWYDKYIQLIIDGCIPESISMYIEMHNFSNFLMTYACSSYDVDMMEHMIAYAWS